MANSITRDDAIDLIAEAALPKLTLNERNEFLHIAQMENWNLIPAWKELAPGLKNEFEAGEPITNPEDSRYDPVLKIWLSNSYYGARNEFLLLELRKYEFLNYDEVAGEQENLEACPCCGYRTLEELNQLEICCICWWEDEGVDNEHAMSLSDGPNDHVNLARGRINFLVSGIYDPDRADLKNMQEPLEKYSQGRFFVLDKENKKVYEPHTNWEIPFKVSAVVDE